ncbi:hypothetical protein ACFTXO_02610 [Streptomyces sp. NPDC057067]|uniref:hypothetical protein n=1 Tax=Streptomyces TaxID=1883 RepID=UPI00192290DD|nr:hypothetical protein [Streptomyces silvae]MBL1291598.1 hypothetical protein [Streptomyces silvae]
MQISAPLPHVDLTDAQWGLLAELVTTPQRDPGSGTADAEAAVARGIDAGQVQRDEPLLNWLKLIERRDGRLAATALGAAVHYRRLCESSERRLSEVVRLAEAHETTAPHLALAVRLLAQGSVTFDEALSGAVQRPA